jgi:hypothetical protein
VKLTALIYNYINGGNKGNYQWSTDRIEYNWNSNELLEWIKNNPRTPPSLSEKYSRKIKKEGFDIKKKPSKITGEIITDFTGLVIHFKKLFRASFDKPLRALIEVKNESIQKDIKLNFTFKTFENIELYTDLDKLIQGYGKFISLIIDNHFESDIPSIELSFFRDKKNSKRVYFIIHHVNTFYKKSADESKNFGDRLHEIIEMQLNGVCNIYLSANFLEQEYARINLWNGANRRKRTKGITPTKGVKYILEFFQK